MLFTYDVISPPQYAPLLGNRVTYPAEHILLSLVHFLPPQYTRHYIFTHLKWTYPNLCYIITWLGIQLLLTDSCCSSKELDRGISISVYLFEQYYKIIIQPVTNLFIHVATHLGQMGLSLSQDLDKLRHLSSFYKKCLRRKRYRCVSWDRTMYLICFKIFQSKLFYVETA